MTALDTTAFRERHPVDVRLTNPEGEPAFRLLDADDPGERLDLVLVNASPRAFWLQDPEHDRPRASNHHVELRFRPGVIDAARAGEVRLLHTDAADPDGARWDLSHERNDDDTISLFLLRDRAAHIRPGERLHLVLSNLVASPDVPGGGSTLVETVVRGRPGQRRRFLRDDVLRVHRLALRGRRGAPHLPLEAAWVGTDTVLNDGKSENALTLDLVNVGTDPLVMAAGGLDTASRITIADVADHDADPRRLSSAARLATMEVEATTPGWQVTVDDEGPRPVWHVAALRPTTIEPGGALTMTLRALVCDASSGPAVLTIDHARVPGHWDGRRTAVVRKAPLLFRRSSVEGDVLDHVGIGTTDPRLPLSIGRADTGLETEPDGTLALRAKGSVGLRVTPDRGAVAPRGLFVPPTGQPVDVTVGRDGSGVHGDDSGALRLRTLGQDRVVLDEYGRVLLPGSAGSLLDLSVGDWYSGISGSPSDGSLAFYTANIERIRLNRYGSIVVGDINATDTVEIRGRGAIISLHNLSHPGVRWGLSVAADDGALSVRLLHSGRGDRPTMLNVHPDGTVTVPGTLVAGALRVAGVDVDVADLRPGGLPFPWFRP